MNKDKKNKQIAKSLPREKIVITAVVLVVVSMFIIKQKTKIPPQNAAGTNGMSEESVPMESTVPPEDSVPIENITPSEEPLSTETFASEKLPQLLELGSESCIPCKMMRPILAELTAEYEGQMVIKFIDVYEHSSIANEYKIRGIPTQIFLDTEGKEISRNVGFMPKDEILKRWQSLGFEFKKNPSAEKKDG